MALQPILGLCTPLLLRFLNHIQLDARYYSSGRVITPSQRSLPTQDNTTYKYNR
jgi:hypothetical protein